MRHEGNTTETRVTLSPLHRDLSRLEKLGVAIMSIASLNLIVVLAILLYQGR